MIALLTQLVWADPGALTTGAGDVSAEIGIHERSVAIRTPSPMPDFGVSLFDRSAVQLAAGWRKPTAEAPWRGEWSMTVGATALLIEPGAALSITSSAMAGRYGDRSIAALGLVTPISIGTTSHPIRIPLLLSVRADAALGPIWLGLRLRAGPVWTPGAGASAFLEPALTLGLRTRRLTGAETSG